MVNFIHTLLLCGVLTVASTQLVPDEALLVTQYQRVKQLRPLGVEFAQYYGNISVTDWPTLPNLPSPQDLQCLRDMGQLMQSLTSGKFWALKMIDSWGTFPSGILQGNLIDMGNYDECVRINKEISSTHSIKGKYCFLQQPLLNATEEYYNLKIGVCFPSSCSAANMDKFIGQLLKKLFNINKALGRVKESSCLTHDREPFDGLTIFIIVLLSVFCAIVILCTLYDYFLCQDQEKLPAIIKMFSARANSRSLFRIVDSKSNPNVIECLHGMRCLSLIWVIFGHQYLYALMAPNLNRVDIGQWLGNPFANFIVEGVFSVDTFFFLSGLLLVMIALRSMEKTKGKLNVPMMYLHRYLRLTPIVAVAILVYYKLIPQLVDGPRSKIPFFDYDVCERTWFWTLLYVQNYAANNGVCVAHTWYLAVDMQLYIISPILLIALYKWGKKAAGAIFVLMLMLSSCLFATMMINNYSKQFQTENSPDTDRKIYYATHTHAAPWLIGVIFGYFLHISRGKTFQMSRLTVWLGWLLSLAMMFTCIFALYPLYSSTSPPLSMLKESLYYTLTRMGWPIALCWVVFACIQGHGGLANSFLSSPLWQPLSKLSYSAYIWHMFIQELNYRRVRSHTFFSDYDTMLSFWSSLGFTLLMSFVLYIIIEAPLGGLENLLLSSRKTAPKKAIQPKEVQTEEQKSPNEAETSVSKESISTADTMDRTTN